ncbi:NUDIX hydrolase [Leucobacter sp. GX0328]
MVNMTISAGVEMQYESASVSERRTMPPAVAVSTVAFALRPPLGAVLGSTAGAEGVGSGRAPTLWIPLVRRTRAPFQGLWALPGGPTRWNETLADTALRSLHAAVLRPPGYLEQLYSFGGVERSAEAQRLVTIAYWALYGEHDLAASPSLAAPSPADDDGAPSAAARWDDAAPAAGLEPDPADADEAGDTEPADPNVAWFSADDLPALAFDHAEIVAYALERLRSKTEYSAIAHRFLGPVFTLGQLRAVHEAVRGEPADPANFRRQELARGTLVDTGEFETGTPHRPARLYRFRDPHEPGPRRPASGPTPPQRTAPNSELPKKGTS